MYKGSCLCGGVELSIQGKITDIIHCHCSLCRKSSGTAFATNGFVNTGDFSITKGKELLSFFEVKPAKKDIFANNAHLRYTAPTTKIQVKFEFV